MKKIFYSLVLLLSSARIWAQEPQYLGSLKELFKGPESPEQREEWLTGLKKWRAETRKSISYDSSLYSNPQLNWVKHTFIYVQMMAHDRFLYNPVTRQYTVKRYLDDLRKRYGGIDAVMVWPTYPNIGIDNRNQFDMVADMPGGLAGVKKMIKDFKAEGVKVFFPIMIWDKGTAPIKETMPEALVKEMKALEPDGMNGDTMFGVSEDFFKAATANHYPLAFQPELSLKNLKTIEWNTLSWGYYFNYTYTPGVSVYKWLEPRHQVNVTNRWAVDKTDDLQTAFFNGVGYNSWENIWTVWNQIPDRYAEAIRRIGAIYRRFPDIWSDENWEPYIPVLQKGVFASMFNDPGNTIYTFINRDSVGKSGPQIALPLDKNKKYYNLWSGRPVTPIIKDGKAWLSFEIESKGYGAILVTGAHFRPAGFRSFLGKMANMAKKRLYDFSASWSPVNQQIVVIPQTERGLSVLKGMVHIPAASSYEFQSDGVMIEGDELPTALGVQHPWESHPSRSQKKKMDIPSFYIDQYPVTNKQFKVFLKATGYHPVDDHHFLKNWVNGSFPPGADNKPVTWVSLDDARAYARWAHKRLPHEWEWQYAAQGNDGRKYPWGNDRDTTKIPPPDTARIMRAPTNVNAYPKNVSPFGVMDMVGNIWQYTDEYSDLHSRFAILKGSSYFHAQTSAWYFPAALELNRYGKYLLMSPGMDRAATIGFRCVVDNENTGRSTKEK